MQVTLYILSFVLLVAVIAALFYWYGEKLTKAKSKDQKIIEDKLNELKDQYTQGLQLQQQGFENKLAEIENTFKDDVLKEISHNDKNATNPFGSYLLPVLKISSLYNVKDVLDATYKAGKLSEQSYQIKSAWLEKEIIRKTGSDYYDDTKIKFDEA